MMWGDYGMGWGLSWLWLILVLVGIGLLIYVAIRCGTRSRSAETDRDGHAGAPRREPRAILEERYARGEIDSDEFTERMRRLDEG